MGEAIPPPRPAVSCFTAAPSTACGQQEECWAWQSLTRDYAQAQEVRPAPGSYSRAENGSHRKK
jgi:hypothetical protein